MAMSTLGPWRSIRCGIQHSLLASSGLRHVPKLDVPGRSAASGRCPQTARTEGADALNSPSSWPSIKFQAPTQQGDSSGTREKEQSMNGDQGVIGYLNKALRHELTAVNQYWLHYRLLDNWGYKVLARTWRKESIEEMQHADKLIERIIFLDGFPNMQVLDPLHIGQNVKEVLDCDLAAEISARTLYEEAATHCHGARDYVTRDLFEKLMKDEEHHIDFLETQLHLVKELG